MAAATGRVPEVTSETPEDMAAFLNDEGDEHYKRGPFRLKNYGGTADAITAEGDPFDIAVINDGTDALLDGQLILFDVQAANTSTTPTLAIDSVAAKTIAHLDSSALAVGELEAGQAVFLRYDSGDDELHIVGGLGFDLANIARLDQANTFDASGAQTIQRDAVNAATLHLICDEASASAGPILRTTRQSDSPADNDVIGSWWSYGENDANEDVLLARIQTVNDDVTDGNESAFFDFRVRQGGSEANQLLVGAGVYHLGRSAPGNGILSFGEVRTDELQIDTNCHLEINGSDPRLTYDANDYVEFLRSTNVWRIIVASSTMLAVGAATLSFGGPVTLASYTVGTLPTGAAGRVAYASDARKSGEGAASGTGCPVFHDGSNWLSDPYNNVTAVA